MRRVWIVALLVPVLLASWLFEADARRRRRRKRPPATTTEVVNKRSAAAIAALVGKYKWKLQPMTVVKLLTGNLKKVYIGKIRKSRSEPTKQDRLRRELAAALAKVKKSFIKFQGTQSGWDSSIIEDQFAHRNDESMVVFLEKEQQRFFFFHDNKLWKQFIAFNADHPNYKGLTFPQFLGRLIKAFGAGKPVFQKDSAGQSRLHHVEWIGANNIYMWAVDKSTIYGNFCVVLFHNTMKQKVLAGRKANPSTRPGVNPMIDAVTKPRREDQY